MRISTKTSASLFALLLVATTLLAQSGYYFGSNFTPVVNGGTWTLVQHPVNGACAAASASCTVTLTQNTGSGNILIAAVDIYSSTSGIKLTAVASGAGTWTLCATSLCASTIVCCAANVEVDQAYILSATGGVASLTVTLSAAPTSSTWVVEIIEYHYTGASASYDAANNTTSSNCTSCVAPTLTPSGTNDIVVQVISPNNSITGSLGAPYTNPDDAVAHNRAGAINQASYSQPTWAQSPIGPAAMSVLAIKGN